MSTRQIQALFLRSSINRHSRNVFGRSASHFLLRRQPMATAARRFRIEYVEPKRVAYPTTYSSQTAISVNEAADSVSSEPGTDWESAEPPMFNFIPEKVQLVITFFITFGFLRFVDDILDRICYK